MKKFNWSGLVSGSVAISKSPQRQRLDPSSTTNMFPNRDQLLLISTVRNSLDTSKKSIY